MTDPAESPLTLHRRSGEFRAAVEYTAAETGFVPALIRTVRPRNHWGRSAISLHLSGIFSIPKETILSPRSNSPSPGRTT